MGSINEDGSWSALKLGMEHTSENLAEVERLYSEHPASEQDTVIRMDRLLGQLMPLRAFGDFRFKWTRKVFHLLDINIIYIELQNIFRHFLLSFPLWSIKLMFDDSNNWFHHAYFHDNSLFHLTFTIFFCLISLCSLRFFYRSDEIDCFCLILI